MQNKFRVASAVVLAAALSVAAPAATGTTHSVSGLDSPRGVATRPGEFVVAQGDGSIISIVRSGPREGQRKAIGKVPKGSLAPALDVGPGGVVWALTAGADKVTEGAGTLYRFAPGKRRQMVLNVQRWQRRNPDPYDLEDRPKESNPYGVAALDNGSVLVADAANNSLLMVRPDGRAHLVARVKPRTVSMPAGMEGEGMPPAGTRMKSEAVVTSVTVGADGAYYIGELRGFPGTPGTSQIWRIRPNAKGAVCNPKRPARGACTRYVDGMTSVVSLAAGRGGALFVAELSKKGWMSLESQAPGSDVGAIIRISHDKSLRRELKPGKFRMPGAVTVGGSGRVFATTPLFGPGRIKRAY